MNIRNIYVPETSVNLTRTDFTAAFEHRFPELELSRLLQEISIPKPLISILASKEQSNLYMEAITYLLTRRFVVQLTMYMYLCIPGNVCGQASAFADKKLPPGSRILVDSSNPTVFEQECIAIIANSHSEQIGSLFMRC